MRHDDVNFRLGSWGPQPQDRDEGPPQRTAASLLTRQDWYEIAIRHSGLALVAMERGDEDEAAGYAKSCVRACRRYQLAGGQPWGE